MPMPLSAELCKLYHNEKFADERWLDFYKQTFKYAV